MGKRCLVFSGYGAAGGEDENTPETHGGDSCTITQTYSRPLDVRFSVVKRVNCVLCIFYYN